MIHRWLPSLASIALALATPAQGVSATHAGSGRGPVARVAYVSDELQDDVFELFAAPVDGSAAPVVLSAPMAPGGDVSSLEQVSGGRVVYRADQISSDEVELFVVPDDGSAPPVRLNGPLVGGGDVNDFRVTKEHVLYQTDEVVNGRDELFRVPLDASSPPVSLTPGLKVLHMWDVSADGSRVVFSAFPPSGIELLYVVPTDGSAAPLLLGDAGSPTGIAVTYFWQVELTADGQRVVFIRAEDNDSSPIACELFSARLDGTALVHLNPGPRFSQTDFRLSPDGQRVLYVDRAANGGPSELLSVRVDGLGFALLTPGADQPRAFRISDDSVFCVFASGQLNSSLRLVRLDGTQPFELLAPASGGIVDLELLSGSTSAVFLRGGRLFTLLSPGVAVPISGVGVTTSHTIGFPVLTFTPDARQVLYRSDEAASGVLELYRATVDGSQPAVRLNPPLSGERDVTNFRLAPGGTVVYQADPVTNDHLTLSGVPLDGSLPAVQLDGGVAAGADVARYGAPLRVRRPVRGP